MPPIAIVIAIRPPERSLLLCFFSRVGPDIEQQCGYGEGDCTAEGEQQGRKEIMQKYVPFGNIVAPLFLTTSAMRVGAVCCVRLAVLPKTLCERLASYDEMTRMLEGQFLQLQSQLNEAHDQVCTASTSVLPFH